MDAKRPRLGADQVGNVSPTKAAFFPVLIWPSFYIVFLAQARSSPLVNRASAGYGHVPCCRLDEHRV